MGRLKMWLEKVFLLLTSVSQVKSFRPYVTCVGCETFLQCFLTCPVADYPGVNQFGVYIPKFMREIIDADSSGRTARPKRKSPHNSYKNWRPFYPRLYRGYHRLNPTLP